MRDLPDLPNLPAVRVPERFSHSWIDDFEPEGVAARPPRNLAGNLMMSLISETIALRR